MADYLAEAKWLLDHPDFEQKPATIEEFLGAGYLDIEALVRPGLKETLVNIFGKEVVEGRIGEYEEAMVTGGIGVGKQVDPQEMVLTPTGESEIGSLSVGDEVIGRDGKSHKVTSVHHWEDIERYKITFKDGVTINAGAEHLWTLKKRAMRKINGKRTRVFVEETLNTRDLASRALTAGQLYNYSLPLVEPVHFAPGEDLRVPPYIMGLMLANGAFSHGTPSIAASDEDLPWVEAAVKLLVPDLRAKTGDRRISISGTGGVENRIQAGITHYGLLGVLAKQKFIPDAYKYASPEDRLEMLRGLMDGDGSACGNNRQNFSSSSARLAEDTAWLVRSLGGYCTITSFERNDSVEYQVHVNLDQVCPFKNPRKVKNWKPRKNQRPNRAVVSVEKIERGPGVCISVDAPDHLYVLRDFIVTHNTTFASIAIPFMVHWVLCLRDPQGFFNLLPGSRIAFMQMSTSEKQALDVIFGDIKARVEHSEWFVSNYQYDPKYTKMIKFPKDIWVLPGDSAETTFEGYNILGGILDEMDSHKVTQQKDYAEEGFNTIQSRIASRFIDPGSGGHRGLLICIGQMKKGNGFAARKYDEMLANPRAYVSRMSIWESLGWEPRKGHKGYLNPDGTRDSFWYDKKRKHIVPDGVVDMVDNDDFVEIPNDYKAQFRNNPEKALRDLAGIPPATKDPFISLTDRIDECVTRWVDTHGDVSPVGLNPRRPEFQPWFRADNDPRRRAMHLDLAVSGDGDALGMTMGHVSELVDIEGELKPFITLDCLIRIKAGAGEEILLSDVRRVIYELRDERKFRLVNVTMDGFQSTDTLQQLRKKKCFADYLSVDRTTLPYEDLREAIYERRLAFPPYMTYLNVGDIKQVAIAVRELQQLSYTGKKVDHPPEGSKDIADAMAGVVSTLMGDRTYRRGVSSTRSTPENSTPANEDWQSSLGFEATPNTIIDPFGNVLGGTGGDYTADPMSPLLPKRLRG